MEAPRAERRIATLTEQTKKVLHAFIRLRIIRQELLGYIHNNRLPFATEGGGSLHFAGCIRRLLILITMTSY